jgi:hypothetical protein
MTPRLFAAACIAVMSVSHPGAQPSRDQPTMIEWLPDRPLTIRDFKGKVPPRASETSLSWVAVEASWECEGGTATSRVRAVFDPNRSWWREINQNLWSRADDPPLAGARDDGGRGLLAHEQLHFDLTELWARRIRAALEKLPDACRSPGTLRALEGAIDQMEHDWQDEQKRFDAETGHGLDAPRQKTWAARIAKALKESYPGAPAAATDR